MRTYTLFFLACALAAAQPPATPIHRVHVVFSHHLDVGLDIAFKLTKDCVGVS